MERKTISTSLAPRPIGPYEQAVVVGGLVFTSGQIGLDPETGKLVEGGTEAQAERAFESICAILDAAGSSPEDVIKATLYLTDLKDFPKVNAIYERFFGKAKPARTTVQVAALPMGASIEADVVARIPQEH